MHELIITTQMTLVLFRVANIKKTRLLKMEDGADLNAQDQICLVILTLRYQHQVMITHPNERYWQVQFLDIWKKEERGKSAGGR